MKFLLNMIKLIENEKKRLMNGSQVWMEGRFTKNAHFLWQHTQIVNFP